MTRPRGKHLPAGQSPAQNTRVYSHPPLSPHCGHERIDVVDHLYARGGLRSLDSPRIQRISTTVTRHVLRGAGRDSKAGTHTMAWPRRSIRPSIRACVRIHVILRVRHDVLVPCVCRHVHAIFIQKLFSMHHKSMNRRRPSSCVPLRRSRTNRRDISRRDLIDRSIERDDEIRRSRIVQTRVTGGGYSRKRVRYARRGRRARDLLRFSQLLAEIKLGSRSFTPLRFTHIKFIHRIIDIYVIKHVQHIPRISYQPRELYANAIQFR